MSVYKALLIYNMAGLSKNNNSKLNYRIESMARRIDYFAHYCQEQLRKYDGVVTIFLLIIIGGIASYFIQSSQATEMFSNSISDLLSKIDLDNSLAKQVASLNRSLQEQNENLSDQIKKLSGSLVEAHTVNYT